ncbi:DNA polymerase III subunit alpha [Salisaeta longa]|uniref:DNA polymerase III subunit alpha n=1 Tax=Salisaeta longa TaxID=503170 RepID=UPI0003B6F4E7|nr:DNA polymerase III subunit alpha [Salisaeta longa]
MGDFCHLHCHTQYSLLDGAASIDALVKQAKREDIPAVAITDHGNLYGVPEFYTTARKHDVQPIIGCEFYVTPSGIDDTTDRTRYHQVLLAKNETGYKNLMKLSSKSFTEGFYYKPRLDHDLIAAHSEGLVATTCCLQGEVLQTILHKGEAAAREIFEWYLDVFGDDYYIEFQDHGIDEQHTCNEVLSRWAKEYDVPAIATNDVHYVEQDDADAQDILLCLQTGKDYNDPNRMRFENDKFYLKNAEEMTTALTGLPARFQQEALVNTRRVADTCDFELPMGDLLMPHYPIPEGFSGMDDYLRHLTFERAKERYGEDLSQRVVDRLNHELGIIQEMGYSGYFLIVQDFTEAARTLDVRVGPGRGSAAGSCVSYCLGITNVDPLEYDLLFERFLNPERVSMPDIDIDFDDRGRSKVIDYVVDKYGRENVCQIITFGTMGAKTALRDVARVLDVPLDEADRIAKMVPDGVGVDLEQAFNENPEFRALKEANDPQVRKTMRYAEVLEGSVRHTGVHAAGVIIAPGDVSEYVPVSVSKSKGEKVITTQYDGDWVEEFGLLKMDFLGLKTLTVINDALRLIEENHGVSIDLEDIPLDDEATYELFQRGETVSIFQFESTGMREWLRKLKPTEINDLIAMNSLYRPGPMENIPDYIDRKHGRAPVKYPHPMLEEILKPTYGIPVYQEQVMQMAQVMGGFSLGKADILRRGMGKKKQKVVNRMKGEFVEGARAQGVDDDTIEEVWELMAKFAGYGFNKCVTGDTTVVDTSTGRRIPVIDIVEGRETDVTVASLDESTQQLVERRVVDAFSSGTAQTYTLKTRTGRRIRATANHPVYTPEGWVHLGDLEVGERVAIPRGVPYSSSNAMNAHEIVVLAYAISEGNLCHPSSFYVYTKSEEELEDYCTHLCRFPNSTATIDRSKSAMSIYARRKDLSKPNGAVAFIDTLGLRNERATTKFVPEAIFQLPTSQIELFLGRLWTGDGGIDAKGGQIFYATSSEQLAHDVHHLLLRLSLPSTIYEKRFKYRGGEKPGYVVRVSSTAIASFAKKIGPHLVGKRKRDLTEMQSTCIGSGRMTQDVIPTSVLPIVRKAVRSASAEQGLSMKGFMRDHGMSPRLLNRDSRKKGYARSTISALAAATQDDTLDQWAASDIYWDEVASIEEGPVEEVYDLTVEDTHNFVANDIIVHNSHAAAYSIVAYQTAYLKAHYPPEFMAAAMTNDMDNNDKLSVVLEEARTMGLDVLPPSVNRSNVDFTVDEGNIRFGLAAVKGAGEGAIEALVDTRREHGPFETLWDVTRELDLRTVNKRTLEALGLAGALDDLEGHRAQLTDAVDAAVRYGQKVQADRAAGQNSLFGDGTIGSGAMEPSLPRTEPWPKSEKLKKEHDVLGFYVSGHPLDEYKAEAEAFANAQLGDTESLERLMEAMGGDSRGRGRGGPVRTFCGILTEVKRATTKKGKPIAFATLEDFTGQGELVCFASVLDKIQAYLEVDKVVLVKGKVELRGGAVSVIVRDVTPMWKVREERVRAIEIDLDLNTLTRPDVEAFRTLCADHDDGHCALYFNITSNELDTPERLRSHAFMIDPNATFMREAQRLFGTEGIRLRDET